MTPHTENRTTTRALMAAAVCVLMAGAGGLVLLKRGTATHSHVPKPATMLLAPMIGVIEPCILAQPGTAIPGMEDLARTCTGARGSAAALIESTLSSLRPRANTAGPYELGYTLPVPLLQLFRPDGAGWSIDPTSVARLARTVRDTERPLILYLFSTHFAADAPIETALASNPANLASTRDGPLKQDTYYASKINNWSFASTQTEITARRVQAIHAVLEEVCRLEPHHIAKIRGLTLLGELHHLFPNFQGGMGFEAPYRVTDYSPQSVADFRLFLANEFKDVTRLNRAVDSDFKSFEEVAPPARDIRTEPLTRFTDHIDSFAQGSLPIAGWAYASRAPGTGPAWVHIYRNGELAGKTPVNLGRQDVLQAKPAFGDANTGWRWDLDFRRLPPGLHRIDIFLEPTPGTLHLLGSRQIAIMDAQQHTPMPMPQKPLPSATPAGPTVQAYIDYPVDRSSYYYNPMVPLWHAFRAQQVVTYLRYFDSVVGDSCLAGTPRYTHQIMPFTNPSWDENKFAIQASLQKMGQIRLGVSLYGEPTYGSSFSAWFAKTAHRGYGITEFHPLKAMSPAAVQQMLARHATQGAEFLSFFMEPRWQGQLVPRGHNMFSLDPDNAEFGSDKLYRSVQQALELPASGVAAGGMAAGTAP